MPADNTETSRRALLQSAAGAGVIASTGAIGTMLAGAAAAQQQPSLTPNSINRRWLLGAHAEENMSVANFKYEEVPLGDTANLKPGEVLVRNIVFQPMPSQRIRMHANTGLGDAYMPPMKLGQPINGTGVSRVVKSANPKFPVGALLSAGGTWEDYSKLNGERMQAPLAAGIDPVDVVGIYGMNAQSAYFGLTRIGEVKAGETIVVSGASGSVGSTVVQIARNRGAKVIGIAGGKEKCDKLVKEYGIHACIDYKGENISKRVAELAPKGVDVYFDNVGGAIMQDVVDQMAKFGRVVLCGTISSYDSKNPAPGPRNMLRMVVYSVKLQGFLYTDYMADRDMAIAELRKMKEAGQLTYKTDVRTGFKNLPQSFLTLFSGEKEGALLVKNDETVI